MPGDHPQDVAQFLMRCLFTMFAEDVTLLPKHGFRDLLKSITDPAHFQPVVQDLWQQLNVGGFSLQFRKKLLQFNGGLFADPSALPVNRDQLDLLIEAAGHEWRPTWSPPSSARSWKCALDPVEPDQARRPLYAPRVDVERSVLPTIIEPIRLEWENAARRHPPCSARQCDAAD